MNYELRREGFAQFDVRNSPFAILIWCGMAGSLGVSPAVFSADVQLVRIDGTTLTGAWGGSPDGHTVELQSEGRLQRIPLDELAGATFMDHRSGPPDRFGPTALSSITPPPVAADGMRNSAQVLSGNSVVFHLADGGHLFGDLVDESAPIDAVVGRTALGDNMRFPFGQLSGIQLAGGERFPRAYELFRSALTARLPGQDILITRGQATEPSAVGGSGSDEVTAARGRLESLSAVRGTFVFQDRTRTFQTERIFGIVFAAGPLRRTRERSKAYPVTVLLADGSVFSGRIERADTESVRIATSLGFSADVRLAGITNLRFDSERVVYLSDLEPLRRRVEGILHRPWPVRFDKNVSGGPLSLGGRTFEKGIGVHSRTELTFEVGGAYETFVATIGLDDSVRPRGSVVFRVLGDFCLLFGSDGLTGMDAPRDIKVDVSGVKTLTLVVDYGDELDLADHADWGGARLLKPAARGNLTTQ